jgi:hypothetical protein
MNERGGWTEVAQVLDVLGADDDDVACEVHQVHHTHTSQCILHFGSLEPEWLLASLVTFGLTWVDWLADGGGEVVSCERRYF